MDLFFILSLDGKEEKMHESFIKKVDEHGGSYMFEVCTIVFFVQVTSKESLFLASGMETRLFPIHFAEGREN